MCQERAAELGTSLESLERIEPLAAAALEPMRALYEHMRKLPYTYAPLRAFQEQLGVLAGSFVPMKALDSGAPLSSSLIPGTGKDIAATDN